MFTNTDARSQVIKVSVDKAAHKKRILVIETNLKESDSDFEILVKNAVAYINKENIDEVEIIGVKCMG